MLTVADVAAWLALGEGWVREHAAELGGVKVGDDPRAPLRFPRGGVEEWIESRRLRPAMTPVRPRISGERVKLLPLRRERP
jgi:hypothetical protein